MNIFKTSLFYLLLHSIFTQSQCFLKLPKYLGNNYGQSQFSAIDVSDNGQIIVGGTTTEEGSDSLSLMKTSFFFLINVDRSTKWIKSISQDYYEVHSIKQDMHGNAYAIVISGSNEYEYMLIIGSVSLQNPRPIKLTFQISLQILKKSLYIDQNYSVYLICSQQDTDTHYIIVYYYQQVQKFQISPTNPIIDSQIILKNPFFGGNASKVRLFGKIQFGTRPNIWT
ncbi:UNKNOWN [Stylonychia lemnae]|uniref:Transmembrane protein n=1 Tax=Stylonychia lemnae TaxID=5949 RepID=A0A078AC11_STYLE|nr:UNKNOWN [Stylonychia lemnae]|eukprot:CDW79744.1 UNKNOWN [Stylonychia lemnae]